MWTLNVAILGFLHLGVALGNKLWTTNLRQMAFATSGSRLPLGNLTLQLKAESFVNSSTDVGEIGGIRLMTARGVCISCTTPLRCSSLDEPVKGMSVAKACNPQPKPGDMFSWKVDQTSGYDIRVDFPLEKLNGQLDFVVEILSALDLSGANNELKKGRQVTNWITTLTIGTQDHAAWMKVAVNMNGDFKKVVVGRQAAEFAASAKEAPRCGRVKIYLRVTAANLATSWKQGEWPENPDEPEHCYYEENEEDAGDHYMYLNYGDLDDLMEEEEVMDALSTYQQDEMQGLRPIGTLAERVQVPASIGQAIRPREAMPLETEQAFAVCGWRSQRQPGGSQVFECGAGFSAEGTFSLTAAPMVGSTLAAETQSLLTGLGELIWAKAIHAHAEIAEAMDPEFSVETFREGGRPRDKFTALDVAIAREKIDGLAEECLRPNDISGYHVTELSMARTQLNVLAQCAAKYKGAAKVSGCQSHGDPYALSGCEAEVCVAPSTLTGYVVKSVDLKRPSFTANVLCDNDNGYHGTAIAEVCSANGHEYTLGGCGTTTSTSTTTTTSTTTSTTTT
ncbi:unnamed protein product, partial [Symbiodinium necroappetens]